MRHQQQYIQIQNKFDQAHFERHVSAETSGCVLRLLQKQGLYLEGL